MRVMHETETPSRASGIAMVSAEFVGQIATAVWLGKLNDAAAHEALWSYALACHGGKGPDSTSLQQALLVEYRRRRARQDACG